MTDPVMPDPLDGFHVEIDIKRGRADVILDRPPLNVIAMAQREQLRAAFEALDAEQHVRIVVVRALGEHFSSGGEIGGFLDPSTCRASPGTSPRRRAVAAGDRRESWLLFRGRLRTGARLRFPRGLGDLPLCAAGAAARPDPGLRRGGTAAEEGGIARAKDTVMRSRRLGGRQAYEWGVATECVADGELEAAAG
jgi:2-oxoglutaroyl-CoA hydrolase